MMEASRDMRSSNPLRGPVAISALLHALAFTLLVPRRPEVAPMRLPGTARGSHIELAYLPGRAPAPASLPTPRALPRVAVAPVARPKLSAPATPSPPPSTNATSPPASKPDSLTGADALGDGDVNIALASFFPRPKPDLSSLPRGSSGDVILDVVIDSSGKISEIRITHSFTPGIDQTVVATVQQWTFHPATRDGQPIASEQELHFHYERG